MQVARQVAWTEAEVEDRPGQVPEVLIDRSQVVRVLMLPGAEETDVQVRRTRSTPAEHRPQSPSRSQAPGRCCGDGAEALSVVAVMFDS